MGLGLQDGKELLLVQGRKKYIFATQIHLNISFSTRLALGHEETQTSSQML